VVARVASKWLAVYRRGADGWQVVADAFNTDAPLP
jgi:ketosteroid isomerase-like protein